MVRWREANRHDGDLAHWSADLRIMPFEADSLEVTPPDELGRVIAPLLMDVHGNSEDTLGVILTNDIGIENRLDFFGGWNTVTRLDERILVLFADDIHAQLNAFIADEYGWACNKLANLMLALAAE